MRSVSSIFKSTSSICVGNTLTPRITSISSARPERFSILQVVLPHLHGSYISLVISPVRYLTIGSASFPRQVTTSSPLSPGGRTSSVSGSIISGINQSSLICIPQSCVHSPETPGRKVHSYHNFVYRQTVLPKHGASLPASALSCLLLRTVRFLSLNLLMDRSLFCEVPLQDGAHKTVATRSVTPISCKNIICLFVFPEDIGITDAPIFSRPPWSRALP